MQNATTGTNALVWGNLLAGVGSFLALIFSPDTIMNLLGSKYGWLAPGLIFIVNWLGHGLTGNSATSVLPGVIAPLDTAKGNLG